MALEVEPETIPLGDLPVEQDERKGISELFKFKRSFWVSTLSNLGIQTGYYGITLWTPTLLILVIGLTPSQSAFYMVFITLGALPGRFGLSYLSGRCGWLRTGALAGF